MNITYNKQRATRVPKKGQKKLDVLARNFKKLDENRKDCIRDLTRQLADIHCKGGWQVKAK